MSTKRQTLPRKSKSSSSGFRIKVIIHPAEEGDYWAEVPALPGCFSEGETLPEIMENIRDAIHGCLSVDVKEVNVTPQDIVEEIEL